MSSNSDFNFPTKLRTAAVKFPRGVMSKSTIEIYRAATNKKYAPKGLGSAIKFIQYYLNRGGSGISDSQRNRIEKAKEMLQKDLRRVSRGRGKKTPSIAPRRSVKKRKFDKKRSNSIKVMSWNVLAAAATKYHSPDRKSELGKYSRERHNKLVKKILLANADLVFLQEVDKVFARRLRTLKNYKTIFKIPPIALPKNAFGNAIMFKHDVLKKVSGTTKLLWSKSEKDFDRKNALMTTLSWNNRNIDVSSLHLSGRKKDARQNLLNKITRQLQSPYSIIGGDFNCDTKKKDCLGDIKMEMKSVKYTTCSFDYDPKHRPTEIDKILVSPNLRLSDYSVEKENCGKMNHPYRSSGSDHFPLVTRVNLKHKSYQANDCEILATKSFDQCYKSQKLFKKCWFPAVRSYKRCIKKMKR